MGAINNEEIEEQDDVQFQGAELEATENDDAETAEAKLRL